MDNRRSEFSAIALLAMSFAFAAVGLLVYLALVPVSPSKLVQLEHAVVSGSLTR